MLQRDAFGQALIEAGEILPRLIVVDADNGTATRTSGFAEHFPERFFNVGVAEQNLIGVSVGLALCGNRVVACTFAAFLCGRAFEMIRNCVALNRASVVLVGTHAGISVGKDGATHFATEDIALMRCLPNIRVVVPADNHQVRQLLVDVLMDDVPTYFRISRWGSPEVSPVPLPLVLGRGVLLEEGDECCVIATGLMVHAALSARKILELIGIRCAVAEIHTIKPLDESFILYLAEKYKRLVIAEEHSMYGGLFGAITELLAEQLPTSCIPVGLRDTFAESGTEVDLFRQYGLTAEHIVRAVRKSLGDGNFS